MRQFGERESEQFKKLLMKKENGKTEGVSFSLTQCFHPSPCLRLSRKMEGDYRGEAGVCSHFSNKKPNY